ncbi:MAG: molybdenum cofactor biosynthesis protein MoaB [Bryobacterales bacterium]|nr:molybdenum cofactor biosynthesis protein MoaB [Bryobacterales bacterium]
MESVQQHRREASDRGPVRLAIITVSDTRTPKTDRNGQWLQQQILAAGHEVTAYVIVKDDPSQLDDVLNNLLATDAQVLLFNGGTGIAPRDNTYDALARRLEKTLPGFGEIFRMLSFEQVGAAAILSRAVAGVVGGRVVFSTPGSHAAVQLAWEKLIAPELQHLAWEVVR